MRRSTKVQPIRGEDPGDAGERALEEVFADLYAMRQAWAAEATDHPEDFKTCLLGGAWTEKAAGQVADYFCVQARAQSAIQWCEKSSRLSLKAYGENVNGQSVLLCRYITPQNPPPDIFDAQRP